VQHSVNIEISPVLLHITVGCGERKEMSLKSISRANRQPAGVVTLLP
jgi:hypothetical protein